MINIIEKIREAQNNPAPLPEQQVFIEKRREYVIDDAIEYPDPEYLIEIGGVPTMPKGNIVALSAKWKNGKTFFCDILSAAFLGGNSFAAIQARTPGGKVLFFDTEQAKSDTARIRKTIKAMIPEDRYHDLQVYCLRNADIECEDEREQISRFEFISKSIQLDKPDLVFIDGIADLIYNYNDVIESQQVVNKLAAMANEFNCCIVVVMHQNKGSNDKNMKGHLGTMLYQKCSDVFNVEKSGNLFVVSHAVSRHRSCEDIAFKLDANAVPMDAVADRQQQVELEFRLKRAKLYEQIALCIQDRAATLKRSEIVKAIKDQLGYANRKNYEMFNEAVKMGILKTSDKRNYCLVDFSKNNDTVTSQES